ncbi:membrane alanyl aminopeptidase-like [Colias croceus]|uniref:membrane alanyl aminopeptidase-like n=1 Tax=Colias crocea TaxID=72248 RepID=UPI001E280123|nr:membrane alanyl aminopeptidase-like [Colias croceus]
MLLLAALFLLFSPSYGYIYEEECLNYTIYPAQYELTIIPHVFKDGTSYFDCELFITVIVNAPNINVIELDAKDIEIKSGSIKVMNGVNDLVNHYRPYEFDNKKGKLYIYLKEPLQQYSVSRTQYVIRVSYVKYVNSDSDGIFIVPYEGNDGKQTYMYTTRLSPNKAKYFFPCFDNPQFEAVFKFRVYVAPPRPGIQFCNTTLVVADELKRQNFKDDSYGIIEYMPSPQIGVHQAGFHHSEFGSREIRVKNDTLVIWAPVSTLPYYTFVMQFCESILSMIHRYSMINRPLVVGPINIVAVPKILNGFESASWKLLTNSETRLATVNDHTSIKQMERTMFELAQQLSRIWLGNPGEVKRTRWIEEWFKEGVATYFAYYYLTQYNHGEQKINRIPLSTYALQMKHKAMAMDWHHSTPALVTFNRSLEIEIPPRYKGLVAMKTASILWMVENWLGSEKFHQALVKYINSRKGSYVSLGDFMASLDHDTVECLHQFFNGSTASRVLSSWFNQPGYPVVSVNVLRDRTPNAIQLKQRKFSFDQHNRYDSNYLIPISYIVQRNENCFNCLQPRFTIGQTYTFGENLNGGWIILNRNASGYYRVNYDDETWRLIAKTLKENRLAISELNRAQIVNDILALYAAGDIKYDIAIEVLDYLNTELSPMVWEAAVSGFDLLRTEGAHMTKILYDEWQEFMRRKVSTIYKRLMDDIEQRPKIRLFRSNIIEFACSIKHKPCLDDMWRLYTDHRNGRVRLSPDLREACYYVILNSENGNLDMKNMNRYEMEDKSNAEHKMREERRFFYRVPMGHPKPLPIIMSTTTTTEATTVTMTPECDGSVINVISILLLGFALLLNLTIR